MLDRQSQKKSFRALNLKNNLGSFELRAKTIVFPGLGPEFWVDCKHVVLIFDIFIQEAVIDIFFGIFENRFKRLNLRIIISFKQYFNLALFASNENNSLRIGDNYFLISNKYRKQGPYSACI